MTVVYPDGDRPKRKASADTKRVANPIWPNAPWNWKAIKDNGRQSWQVNIYTGKRRIVIREVVCGYQPIDQVWLNGGELDDERMVLWE